MRILKNLKEAYVALGGNIGDSSAILNEALNHLRALPEAYDLKVSEFYLTKPVSDIQQRDYINAVCSFKTTLDSKELLKTLQQIECLLGKQEKPKNAPRVIDLDILFFGEEAFEAENLEIPHPRWQRRLFVLVPLLDLTSKIEYVKDKNRISVDIRSLIKNLDFDDQEIHQIKEIS